MNETIYSSVERFNYGSEAIANLGGSTATLVPGNFWTSLQALAHPVTVTSYPGSPIVEGDMPVLLPGYGGDWSHPVGSSNTSDTTTAKEKTPLQTLQEMNDAFWKARQQGQPGAAVGGMTGVATEGIKPAKEISTFVLLLLAVVLIGLGVWSLLK